MRPSSMFREAAPASRARNLAKTFLQVVFMWGMALAVGPLLIDRAAEAAGIADFHFPGRRRAGLALFLLVSAGGLYTAVVMAWWGEGTPLPLDAARRLVLRGPYVHLRNPMALAGVAQGMAVGVWMGSWPVLAYALAGALLWNFVLRPLEEEDLARRFGAEYEDYRRGVPCWIPRLTPYRPPHAGAEPGPRAVASTAS